MSQRNPTTRWIQSLARSRPILALGRAAARLDAAFERTSVRIEKSVAAAARRAASWAAPRLQPLLVTARGGIQRGIAILKPPLVKACNLLPRHIALGLMSLLATLIAWRLWWISPLAWVAEWVHEPVFRQALEERQLLTWLATTQRLAGLVALLAAPAAILAIVWRQRISWWLLKAVAAGTALLWLLAARLAAAIPAVLHAAPSDHYTTSMRNAAWTASWWYLIPGALAVMAYITMISLSSTRRCYGGPDATTWADRMLQNLRTHGDDPRFRRAQYRSLALHLAILILPFLLIWLRLKERPYEVPKGSGEPVIEMVRVRQVEKTPRERYFLNPDSAISFYVPEIEDSEVFQQVDEMTRHLYEASQIGALGDGGGTTGGWPEGMENARVRFLRLEYDGGDWDHNMGFGYDYNMLLQFRRFTGFNIWPETESIRINRLLHFPRGRAPPFVYLTGGMRGSLQVGESEVRALRQYCLELGGMIFADNAGGQFDRQFRALLRRAFPELPLVEIANDDIIFRQPYIFPQGAPPLWHHSGMRAMGMKHGGRWIVFYHQGELSDAWRDGHSGISPGLAQQAYKMGINVIYYAFTQYMRRNPPRGRNR